MYDIIVLLNLLRYQSAELRSHLQSELKVWKPSITCLHFSYSFANQTVL